MLCCCRLTSGFALSPSFPLSSSVSLALPLSMSVRWFMALFKRRPHVSPDAAICFNPASFFHAPPSEGNQEPTKINPWLLCARQSVFCGSSPAAPASEELDGASQWLHHCTDKVPSSTGPPLLLLGAGWRCRKMTCHKDAINNAHRQGWKNGRRHKALLSA